MEDGAICLLVEREDAPRFEICVVRDEHVVRQNRLYARGSALMLAETWRGNLSRASVPPDGDRALKRFIPHSVPGSLTRRVQGVGTSSGDGMKL